MFKWLTKKKTPRTYTQACTDALDNWVQCGTPQLLKQAYKLGLSVSAPIDAHSGNTVLHVAAQKSSLDSLFVLHGLHAKDTIPNKHGRFAIHIAAACGFREGVQYLLRNMSASIDARDAEGRTPLMLAIANNQQEVVKVLVIRGADVVTARTAEGLYAIHFCRSPDILRYLTTTTAMRVSMQAASGETILHAASRRADVPVAAEAIALGANIGAIDKCGNNALHIACHHGRSEIVPFLVKSGCSATDSNHRGFTPVEQALVRQDCDTSYALYCAGAIFTKRQLLLLSILLRHSSILKAIHSEKQTQAPADGALRAEMGKLERASQAVLSGRTPDPGGLSSLVVVPGTVPEAPNDPGSLEEALQKIHDPVPRPVGSDASAVLVSVFSRFLRHSMHEGGPDAGGDSGTRAEAVPKRYSDSETAAGGTGRGMPARETSPKATLAAARTRGPNAAPLPRRSLEQAAVAASLGPAGRKSLERLLPHYLYGLRPPGQEKKDSQPPSWLAAAAGPAPPVKPQPPAAATSTSAQPPNQRHSVVPAVPAAEPPPPAAPELVCRLPGGPPPARQSMRHGMRSSFMHRPSLAVNGFSGPPPPSLEGDRSTVRRSTFWARGKTAPSQGGMMPPVRRSRTLDLGRRNGQGYGVGSAAYGAPQPRSNLRGVHDDITVARSSREDDLPRGEAVKQDGMWEFEAMMARRVAMFGRPSQAQ
eukprot:jgi/Ulvmu1/857/UM100_0008.1